MPEPTADAAEPIAQDAAPEAVPEDDAAPDAIEAIDVDAAAAAEAEAGEPDAAEDTDGERDADARRAPTERVPALLEALLFVSDGPTDEGALGRALGLARREVRAGLDMLADSLRERGMRLQRGPDGIQLVTAPDAAAYIEAYLGLESGRRLSAAALETLAIIAYRQPVTRGALEAIRGVNCDGAIDTLRNRGLIDIAGRADSPGRPALFATTQKFLEYFGLERPEDLPPLPTEVADAAARLPEHLAQQLPLPDRAAEPAGADAASDDPDAPARPEVLPYEPIETPEGRVWPARAGLPIANAVWLPGNVPALPSTDRAALPPSGPGFSL
ncbi:MAG: SMC-Scp complex subunit ScpB [Dehalococcoidia bacterium]